MKFDKLHIDGWQMTGLKREPNRLSPGIGTGFLQHYVPGDIYLRITPEGKLIGWVNNAYVEFLPRN